MYFIFQIFLFILLLPTLLSWQANFKHIGALVSDPLESSPLYFQNHLYIMQSEMGNFPPDNQPHSFFCIFDGLTGNKIICPNSSVGYAFFSAIVDHTSSVETIWVFGSNWDRAQSHAPGCQPWGCGSCAQVASGNQSANCLIGAWKTTDLINFIGPINIIALPTNITVPNVGVGMVNRPSSIPPPGNLPAHQAFMALEAGMPNHNGHFIAINTGNDYNLFTNWVLLNISEYSISGNVGEASGCPSARYNPKDGYYYVMGGGNMVDLTRSNNLTSGSWTLAPNHIEIGCTYQLENCSIGTNIARIAPNYYTNYWINGSDHNRREFLNNLTLWQYSVNDVDFCDDTVGNTYFLYGTCAQTAPANFTGKAGNFYQLGIYSGLEGDWLNSYFTNTTDEIK